MRDQPDLAVAESNRLAGLGKIFWCPLEAHSWDPRVRASKQIAHSEKVRKVRDCPNPTYGLEYVLADPDVDKSTVGASVGVWTCRMVSCAGWCPPPVSGRLNVFLFLTSGIGLSPGGFDLCAAEVLRAEDAIRPPMRTIDFADDLGLVESRGGRNQLHIVMAWLADFSSEPGVRFHAEGSGRRWTYRGIFRSGFTASIADMGVDLEEIHRRKGSAARGRSVELKPDAAVSTWFFLNFVQRLTPGGFCYLRSGKGIANACGSLEKWHDGAGSAERSGRILEGYRIGMCWCWEAMESRPSTRTQFGRDCCLAWRPHVACLQGWGLSVPAQSASAQSACPRRLEQTGCSGLSPLQKRR